MRLADLQNRRIAVWGYGREGRATLSVLRRTFPGQPLTLFCSPAEAQEFAASLPGSSPSPDRSITVVTQPPDASRLAAFDVIFKSPGISPYREPYISAMAQGVRFTSGSELWFAEHALARTLCVTGTKGKSTVSALIAHLLRKNGIRTALAGNIGLPLLELLQPPVEPEWWVIELSSFQTRDFDGAPTVAVINNVYEEHLDWHGSRARYVADKLALAQNAGCLVFNAQQAVLTSLAAGRNALAFNGVDGWHVGDSAIYRADQPIMSLSGLPMPGDHNAQNLCAALAAVEAAGFDARALAHHVATFKPLPHRLQSLGVRNGVEFINDSISTTPFAAIEALRSLSARPVTVLVGGFDRGVDWAPFVDFVAAHPPHAIVTMGANGASIANALRRIAHPAFKLESAPAFDAAFALAQTLAPTGGSVLLSPGAPSFDQFRDYAERGRAFARLAGFDPADIAQIEGLGVA